MKICEKVKKYDSHINNKRGVDTNTAKNPLIKNKGSIADDW